MRSSFTVAVLVALATSSCVDAQNETIRIEAGGSIRASLVPLVTYIIDVTISPTAVQQYSTLILQAHTQKNILTLGSQEILINGSHVGLVLLLSNGINMHSYYIKCYPHGNSRSSVGVMIVAQLLANEVPIPGGCSTVTSLEYDPNIYLTFNEYTTTWNFSDANRGFDAAHDSSPLICDDAKYDHVPVKSLEYYTYIYYLPEGSYSFSDMFDGIDEMLSSSDVMHNSEKSSVTLHYQTPKTVSYASTPGQGVVYNVVVRDLYTGATSAYVPMVTYSCDFYAKIDGCDSLGSVINKVVGTFVGLLGLLLCLCGHRFFDIELVVLLIVIFSFILFIIITRFSYWSHTVRVSVSIVFGIVATIPFVCIWCFTGFYYPFVVLFGMFMSFLFGATLLYTPLGNLSFLKYNYVYGLGIACCTIIFVLPFILFAKVLNITLCAVIGSYGVIFGISSFVQNSLTDIITDVLKQATVPGYSKDIEFHPYQFTEIILTCLWCILVIAGIVVQVLLTKKRQKFPDAPYKRFKAWRTSRQKYTTTNSNYTPSNSNHNRNEERRRLLSFDSIHVKGYSTLVHTASSK